MISSPLIYIIILNWNGWRDTLACLESIQDLTYSNYQVLVIDNGSEDDSVQQIKAWAVKHELSFSYSDSEKLNILCYDSRNVSCVATKLIKNLTLIEAHENLGFSSGCNLGIAYALQQRTDYVFLLNNDAIAKADLLCELLKVSKEADAAIAGAQVLDSNSHEILFAGRQWPQQLFFSRKLKPDFTKPFWASSDAEGSSILLRRDLLEIRLSEYGYIFDPNLFMYCEDTDLCIYAQSKGHKCVIARDAIIYHQLAASSGGQGNPRSYYYITRNRIFLANRWLDFYWKIYFHLYYIPSRFLIQILGAFRGKKLSTPAVLQGIIDGYFHRTGKWRNHGGSC